MRRFTRRKRDAELPKKIDKGLKKKWEHVPPKKTGETPLSVYQVPYSAGDLPYQFRKYVRENGTIDWDEMPEGARLALLDWGNERAVLEGPSVGALSVAKRVGLPPHVVETAFYLSQNRSVPVLDRENAKYRIPADLGSIRMLRDPKKGKLPCLIRRLDSMMARMKADYEVIVAIITSGSMRCFSGVAEPAGRNYDAPNPLLGYVLMATGKRETVPDWDKLDQLIDELTRGLEAWRAVVEEAQCTVTGREGNTPDPDWLVWVARLIDSGGYGKGKYLALIKAMKAESTGDAAWRRKDLPLPPIPWGADYGLYRALGGVAEWEGYYV